MTIERMEILKLALGHTTDPREALQIAREMAAFLEGENKPTTEPREGTKRGRPHTRMLTESQVDPALLRRIVETPVVPPAQPKRGKRVLTRTANAQQPWSEEDLRRAARMIDDRIDYQVVADTLGRSRKSITAALGRGMFPTRKHRASQVHQLAGAVGAVMYGKKIHARTVESIFGKPTAPEDSNGIDSTSVQAKDPERHE